MDVGAWKDRQADKIKSSGEVKTDETETKTQQQKTERQPLEQYEQ